MKKTKIAEPVRLPISWDIFLFIFMLIGLLFAVVNFPVAILVPLTDIVRSDMWARFLGIYVVSIVASHWIVHGFIKWVDRQSGLEREKSVKDLRSTAILGILESVLYPATLLTNYPDLIGFWLAIKVAGQWVAWSGDNKSNGDISESTKKGRRRFNRFLIGNAIRIMLAGLTFIVFKATVLW